MVAVRSGPPLDLIRWTDWASPQVLLGFTQLLQRLALHGVRWLRLDAVGFVWKEPNTTASTFPKLTVWWK